MACSTDEINKLCVIRTYLYDIQHNQNKVVMKIAEPWKEIGVELKLSRKFNSF